MVSAAPAVAAAGRRRGGDGRRSDIALKREIRLLGCLGNGLGYYRCRFNNNDRLYVGVIAQEEEAVMPDAVVRGRDGYLRVSYKRLGLKLQTYGKWVASGALVSVAAGNNHPSAAELRGRRWPQQSNQETPRTS